jgi:hypothetical protein
MDSTTRRGLLRSLAALPAFAAWAGCRGLGANGRNDQGQRQPPVDNQPFGGQLNVCLHGLWYVEVGKEGLSLYAPTVADHVYRAGAWKQETELDPKVQSYELKGLAPRTTAPPIDDLLHPVLRATPTPDRSKMSTVIKVPFPDEIHGLRCVQRSPTDPPFFADGKYSPRPDLMYLPMNLILVYRPNSVSKTPYLEGSMWKAPTSSPYPSNLHLRAEPLKVSLMDAQGFLCSALGITDRKELQMNQHWRQSPPPPVDPVKPLYGYDRDEQLGLGELFPPIRSAAEIWDDAVFAEIPKLEGSPCTADRRSNSINFAAPSNCSHLIGRSI